MHYKWITHANAVCCIQFMSFMYSISAFVYSYSYKYTQKHLYRFIHTAVYECMSVWVHRYSQAMAVYKVNSIPIKVSQEMATCWEMEGIYHSSVHRSPGFHLHHSNTAGDRHRAGDKEYTQTHHASNPLDCPDHTGLLVAATWCVWWDVVNASLEAVALSTNQHTYCCRWRQN